VILSTGHSERISRESALGTGLAEYLEKPLDLPTLARAVRKVLG
jgi:CheY-like chemotaxis protein